VTHSRLLHSISGFDRFEAVCGLSSSSRTICSIVFLALVTGIEEIRLEARCASSLLLMRAVSCGVNS